MPVQRLNRGESTVLRDSGVWVRFEGQTLTVETPVSRGSIPSLAVTRVDGRDVFELMHVKWTAAARVYRGTYTFHDQHVPMERAVRFDINDGLTRTLDLIADSTPTR